MRILFVSSEVEPYSKTGGLGDVLGALPKAMAARGHECLVVSPRYGSIDLGKRELTNSGKTISVSFPFGRQDAPVLLAPTKQKNLTIAFLEHHGFFGGRNGIYGDDGDYGDNHRRFAFLSRGAFEVCRALEFAPDIVHVHDWQTGLAPLYLHELRGDRRFANARSVFTIHNLGYQGVFGKNAMFDLGLDWRYFTVEGLEFHDAVNFLKCGLAFGDAITTVSRRYAEEIQTPDSGWGLDGALRARRHKLFGILNGVDYEEWNPATDKLIPATYSLQSPLGKQRCHQWIVDTFKLKLTPKTLILGMVTRLAYQKGAELVLQGSAGIFGRDVALVMLGNGDAGEEAGFAQLQAFYPGRCGAYIGFSRELSHKVIAGVDALLVPSRYEPCGLTQMYALRYGTLPIVRATGGLDDTVVDAAQPEGTGFKFGPFSPEALVHAVWRAADLFEHRSAWMELAVRGMAQDFSWDASSRQYEELFSRLAKH
ncbi:MAG: glycogen synthase GlgA [Deltaproteobacteria bacterium]|nr:glycogen synthase GlgA [Deltaproteobacteria bacterium]